MIALSASGAARGMRAIGVAAALLLSGAAALGGGLGAGTVRAVAALALVALLGAAAVRVRRRQAAAAPAQSLRVEERHPLAREVGLALVAAGSRRLLVGYGPAGLVLLAELPAGDPRAAA